MTVDDLLAQARAMLPHQPSPVETLHEQANGAPSPASAVDGYSLASSWPLRN